MAVRFSPLTLPGPRVVVGACLLAVAGCPATTPDADPTSSADTDPDPAAATSTAATSSSATADVETGTEPSTGDDTGSGDGVGTSEASSEDTTTLGSTDDAGSDATGCGDTDSDPMHCGACDHACSGAAHGEAVCQAGTCEVECDAGYHAVDVDGQTRCSKLAGFFLLRETGTCEAANPLTGDCTCPSGFDDRPVTSWRIDPGDGASWVQLAVCSPVAGTPTDSWGGLYAQYEATGSCAFPNPLDVPLCACAAGYSVSSQWLGANINGDAIRISFCTDEPFDGADLFVGGFTEACGGGCAAGAGCSCPAGAIAVEYPTVTGGCATTSTWCYAG